MKSFISMSLLIFGFGLLMLLMRSSGGASLTLTILMLACFAGSFINLIAPTTSKTIHMEEYL